MTAAPIRPFTVTLTLPSKSEKSMVVLHWISSANRVKLTHPQKRKLGSSQDRTVRIEQGQIQGDRLTPEIHDRETGS
jgi:hypothetical protein